MKKASKILGIVGGSISMLIALIIVVVGIFAVTFAATFVDDFFNSDFYDNMIEYENIETYEFEELFLDDGISGVSRFLGAIIITIGAIFMIFALLGIIGGAVVEKSPVLGAIFMFVGGIVSLVTAIGILSGFLMILGGIFSFVKGNSDTEEVALQTEKS